MSLESADWAVQLSLTNPLGSDPRSQGDNHIRLIKKVLQGELAVNNRQWVYTGDEVTRRSTTSFTLTSDKTSTYENFRRLKVVGTSTGTIYGSVSSSTFSATTAVNIRFDSGSMSNESLTVYVGPMTGTNQSLPANIQTRGLFISQTEKLRATDETLPDKGSGAEVRDGNGNYKPVGYNITPVGDLTTAATQKLGLNNNGTEYRATVSGVTIDMDTTTDLAPNGTHWSVNNSSGSTVSITATGVTLTYLDGSGGQTGTRTLADGSFCDIMKRADGQYRIVGNGLT